MDSPKMSVCSRVIALGWLSVAACGGSSSSSSGTSGSGSGSSSSAASGSSSRGESSGSSSASGAGSSSGASSRAGGPTTGSIFISQCASGECTAAPQLLASAQFSNGSQESTCEQTLKSGACTGYTCITNVDAGVPYESAGTLTLSGGKLASPLEFATSGQGNYDLDDTSLAVSPGQTVTVTASGAAVPAFMQSIVAPPALNLTKPTAGSGGHYSISTSADLAVAWSAGHAGDSVLFQALSGASAYYFACTWDATAGEGTVPKAIVAPLAGQQYAEIEWLQGTTKTFDAGGYAITLTASIGGTQSAEFN